MQVFYTSSADVADLIDHLSRDLDGSRGRIDILPISRVQNTPSARRSPPVSIQAPKASATVPAGGFSPKRQMHVRQGFSVGLPGAASSASPIDDLVGRSVEDRLQALLDRLQE